MAIKTYSEEFKRDAVALYENSDGASLGADPWKVDTGVGPVLRLG